MDTTAIKQNLAFTGNSFFDRYEYLSIMNNDEVQICLQKLVVSLRKTPLMYYSGNLDYYSFKIFICGYSMGLSCTTGYDLLTSISEYLLNKNNIPTNLSWMDHIEHDHPDLSDEDKRSLVL